MLIAALVLVALLLSVIALAKSRGQDIALWALFFLALAVAWPHLPLR
jgi:hypothetical protein